MEVETKDSRMDERRKLDVMELKCMYVQCDRDG